MEAGMGFLLAGYSVAVVILLLYLTSLYRRQRALEKRLEGMADNE